MVMFFKTRAKAREFAAKGGRKIVDLGKNCEKRWALVLKDIK